MDIRPEHGGQRKGDKSAGVERPGAVASEDEGEDGEGDPGPHLRPQADIVEDHDAGDRHDECRQPPRPAAALRLDATSPMVARKSTFRTKTVSSTPPSACSGTGSSCASHPP